MLSGVNRLNYNLYFEIATTPCDGCTTGPNAIFEDPLFADPLSFDFTLTTGSPAIDSGVDLGIDVNGAQADNYNGIGPDIGYFEL